MRGQTWLCVQNVPRPLRAVIGKDKLLLSLKTGDLRTAQRRRPAALAGFEEAFEAARKALAQGPDTAAGEAMRYRTLAALMPPSNDANAYDGAEMIADRAAAIERHHGAHRAAAFVAVASGRATPIDQHIEAWMREGNYPPRSCIQHRATVAEFVAWVGKEGETSSIEAVTKQVAGRFASTAGDARQVTRSTVNRKLSSLRAYWSWLERKGHVQTNPWRGQTLPAPRQEEDGDKSRPFTDKEALTLLSGDASPILQDFMRFAALTGARLGGLANLRVGDCADGWLFIRKDKSKAGRRRVPIHSLLLPIVERRSAGKDQAAWLFDELATDKQGERSSFVSQEFTEYRLGLNLDERGEGRRRSNITFHSWRHYFATKARQAGHSEDIVQQVIGHKPQTVLGRVYYAGGGDDALRACVESVMLPVEPVK